MVYSKWKRKLTAKNETKTWPKEYAAMWSLWVCLWFSQYLDVFSSSLWVRVCTVTLGCWSQSGTLRETRGQVRKDTEGNGAEADIHSWQLHSFYLILKRTRQRLCNRIDLNGTLLAFVKTLDEHQHQKQIQPSRDIRLSIVSNNSPAVILRQRAAHWTVQNRSLESKWICLCLSSLKHQNSALIKGTSTCARAGRPCRWPKSQLLSQPQSKRWKAPGSSI